MDIYRFINSKDVINYCKKTGHVFNPIETAYMIYISDKTIEEKNRLYQELIDEYPNMQFHESVKFPINSSLHDYLKALIEWNKISADFFYNPNQYEDRQYYYTLGVYDADKLGLGPEIDIIKDAFKKHKEYKWFNSVEELFKDIYPYWDKADNHKSVRVFLKSKRQTYFRFYADYNKEGKIIEFDDNHLINKIKHPGQLHYLFINYPVPFKIGDIVCSYHEPETPYVLSSLPISRTKSLDELSGSVHPNLDTPDFAVVSYITPEGFVKKSFDRRYSPPFPGWGIDLRDLEYFRLGFDESTKKLLVLSENLKKQMCV